jgi:ectoine hydrolase
MEGMPFAATEYDQRVARVQARMATEGLDALVVTNPAHMNYLTGYDAWSFYQPQGVIVERTSSMPLWIGRPQDSNSARLTTRLDEEHILTYPEEWIELPAHHPAERFASCLAERGWGRGRIGIEADSYFTSPRFFLELRRRLPEAELADADRLVAWVRAVKSAAEIQYMRAAARIAEAAMTVALETIRPGVRECDAAAEIVRAQLRGTPEFGGDYPALFPLLLVGPRSSASHSAWTDAPFGDGQPVALELSGCRRRYTAALCRTMYLGAPTSDYRRLADVVGAAHAAALGAVRPGRTCEEVEAAWREALRGTGFEKESRLGYTIGLSYPPNWGERTASFRPGDTTVLEPNMTFHLLGGIWLGSFGYELSETIRVSEDGVESLTGFERRLFVRA